MALASRGRSRSTSCRCAALVYVAAWLLGVAGASAAGCLWERLWARDEWLEYGLAQGHVDCSPFMSAESSGDLHLAGCNQVACCHYMGCQPAGERGSIRSRAAHSKPVLWCEDTHATCAGTCACSSQLWLVCQPAWSCACCFVLLYEELMLQQGLQPHVWSIRVPCH